MRDPLDGSDGGSACFDRTAYGELLSGELIRMNQVRSSRFFPVFFLNTVQLGPRAREQFAWPEVWSADGDEPVVIMRDSQNSRDAFFLAAKGGRAADNHGNMDAGSFVFELDGVRWSVDPGNQDYNELEQLMGGGALEQCAGFTEVESAHKKQRGAQYPGGERRDAPGRCTGPPVQPLELEGSSPECTFDLSELYGDHIQVARRSFSRLYRYHGSG